MPSRRSLLSTGGVVLSSVLAGCSSLGLSRTPSGTDWTASVPQPATLSPPVVTGDRLVVGGHRNGALEDGRVAALDTKSGEHHWSRDVGRMTGLTAANDTVYVGEKGGSAGSRARVLAFDAETGERRWTQPVANLASALAVAGDTLYAANGTLAALDAEDGSIRWEQTTVAGTDFTVVVAPDDQLAADDSAVYFGDERGVVALDPADGSRVWTWRPDQWDWTTVGPIPVGERIYVGADDAVASLDRATGELRWQTSFGADARVQGLHETESSLLVAEATDEPPSDTFGTMYELAVGTGRERYETRFETPVMRTASTTETFIVGTEAGKLVWTDGASSFGRRETTLPSESFVLGGAGEQAFAQTGSGTLYALSPPE